MFYLTQQKNANKPSGQQLLIRAMHRVNEGNQRAQGNNAIVQLEEIKQMDNDGCRTDFTDFFRQQRWKGDLPDL